jgi:hypothetical protein
LPFSGNVETIPLDEVIQFIASNSIEGTLTVAGGGARLTLHFVDGLIFFPFAAKRGTYSLGKILRQTGVLSREALEKHLEQARQNRIQELRALEGQASTTQLEDARRRQYEEEFHDVFLWRRAYFEFTPGPPSEEVQRDRALGKGALFEPTALLMEVARRSDERRRIRRWIPTGRAILCAKPDQGAAVEKALAARRIDVSQNPFDGKLSLEELLERWGVPHHDALGSVAPLVETGKVQPLALDAAKRVFESALGSGDARMATRALVHLVELGPPPSDLFELGPEKELLESPSWRSQPASGSAAGDPGELALTTRVSGPRAFTILRALLAHDDAPFTFTAREDGREKRLVVSRAELELTSSPDDVTPSVARYLRRLGVVSEPDYKEASAAAKAEGKTTAEVLVRTLKASEGDFRRAVVEKIADELGELVLWRDIEVEVRNRSRLFSGRSDPSRLLLSVPLGSDLRARLREGIERWLGVARLVPGEDALFLEGDRAKDADPAAKFFSRFDGRRTVGELRRLAKAEPLEFLRFVQLGLKRNYARRPSREELTYRLERALERQDDVSACKLARAGVVFGLGDPFAGHLEKLRALDAVPSPDSRASLEGDMKGLSLAAVLQGLRGRKRTGTLSLSDGKRETKLFFHRGAVFLLRVEDAAAREFVDFFLDGGEKSIEFVGVSVDAKGQVHESQLDANEARRVKDDVLEVLFWEDARFTFWKNDLPPEFFEPSMDVTKVALNTDAFLLEAIGRIQEWDSIQRVIPTGKCVLAFGSLDAKLRAIQERGMSEVLTIVDGRHSFDDVVRISNEPRLDVGRVLRDLVEAGDVRVREPEPSAISP